MDAPRSGRERNKPSGMSLNLLPQLGESVYDTTPCRRRHSGFDVIQVDRLVDVFLVLFLCAAESEHEIAFFSAATASIVLPQASPGMQAY
jgi:hypothetical protein